MQDIIFSSVKYSPNVTFGWRGRKNFELSSRPQVQCPHSSEIGHVQLLQSTPGTILANKSPPEGQARDIWSLGEVRHRGIRFRQAHQDTTRQVPAKTALPCFHRGKAVFLCPSILQRPALIGKILIPFAKNWQRIWQKMGSPQKVGTVWRHRVMIAGKRVSGTFDTKAAALAWEAE